MPANIDHALAMQIINTMKDLCGQDINFINQSGIIFASTNPGRTGTFHEIGQKAAQTGTMIEVSPDDRFHGTQPGINLPIYHNHSFVAVIGITGAPDEVRAYAHLAERITRLLIRERELHMISRSQTDKKHFVIDSLIRKADVNMDYLQDCLNELSIDARTPVRMLLIRNRSGYDMTSLSTAEQKTSQLYDMIPLSLHTFRYPDEYLAVIGVPAFEKNTYLLECFARENKQLLETGVGKAVSIFQLSDSYTSAVTACKNMTDTSAGFVLYDNLTLEIILSGLSETERDEYRSKTTACLSDEERHILQTYFDLDMSLQRTSRQLFYTKIRFNTS